jgi:hypothetical protein
MIITIFKKNTIIIGSGGGSKPFEAKISSKPSRTVDFASRFVLKSFF